MMKRDWDQDQREAARGIGEQRIPGDGRRRLEVVRDPYGTSKLRYVDPNTGNYYDMDMDPAWKGMPTFEVERQVRDRIRSDEYRAEAEKARRYYEEQKPVPVPDNIKRQMLGDDEWQAIPDTPMAGGQQKGLGVLGQSPLNTLKATLHKVGHFPTQWMREAVERAEASDMCVTLTVEREGVLVTAIEADDRFDIRVTDWAAMEAAEENPLIHAIEQAERKMGLLARIKAKLG